MKTLLALTLLLIIAKVVGYVAWSWWIVISPMYVLLFLLAVLIYGSRLYGEKLQWHHPLPRKHRPF
jgi:hypothetical protein